MPAAPVATFVVDDAAVIIAAAVCAELQSITHQVAGAVHLVMNCFNLSFVAGCLYCGIGKCSCLLMNQLVNQNGGT